VLDNPGQQAAFAASLGPVTDEAQPGLAIEGNPEPESNDAAQAVET
jgi:hypothetical protein